MYNIKSINISNLISDTSHYVNKMLAIEEDWLAEVSADSSTDLANKYASICQKHSVENKWVLMINPEDDSLDALSKNSNIDVSKVLRVNATKTKVNLKSIENALRKGNCSAIVLPSTLLTEQQITKLTKCAQRGRTQFIIINKTKLH